MRLLTNALLIEFGWYVCVVFGNAAALLYVVCALIVHFSYVSQSAGEWRLIFLVAAAGTLLDTFLMHAGVFQWPDGSVYKGEWRNCREHGKGKFTGVNGTAYEGLWDNGRYHGRGRLTTYKGEVFTGEFHMGKFMD